MKKIFLILSVFAFVRGDAAFAQLLAGANKITTNKVLSPVSSNEAMQRRNLASQLFQSGEFEKAAQQWKALVDSGGNSAADTYWLAESYYHLHRYADAAKCFEQTTVLDPKMDSARVREVQAYLADKNQAQARIVCAAALPVVAEPYARKQLETLLKIAAFRGPFLPKATLSGNQIEVPRKGK